MYHVRTPNIYDIYKMFEGNCLMSTNSILITQIAGKKELILANRSELELGHFQRDGSYSTVDVDSVDLNSYPGFGELTFYNATIEAGDCVYIPTFWGHAVRSWGRFVCSAKLLTLKQLKKQNFSGQENEFTGCMMLKFAWPRFYIRDSKFGVPL